MKNSKMTVYQMCITALMAAVMCILGPMSVPIGAVPISFTNLVVYFSIYLLGTRLGTVSYLVYLALGAVGLPVFSAYSGGLAKLAGPTGGYLIGFIPMAVISGLFLKKSKGQPVITAVGMVLGTLVAYALGTVWFVFQLGCGYGYALGVCVLPFIPGDLIKIVLAVCLGSVLRRRLVQASLLKEG